MNDSLKPAGQTGYDILEQHKDAFRTSASTFQADLAM
jgi:hypothetical protein